MARAVGWRRWKGGEPWWFIGPNQQHSAGRMVEDEPCRMPDAVGQAACGRHRERGSACRRLHKQRRPLVLVGPIVPVGLSAGRDGPVRRRGELAAALRLSASGPVSAAKPRPSRLARAPARASRLSGSMTWSNSMLVAGWSRTASMHASHVPSVSQTTIFICVHSSPHG